MDNQQLAQHLFDHAHSLDAERGNLYRARAYRWAAQAILELDEPAAAIFERGGKKALEELPGIGPHIALAIENLLHPARTPGPSAA